MAMVVAAVVANIPYQVVENHPQWKSSKAFYRIAQSLFTIQHIYSPLVYLLFFAQFRAAAVRFWGRLRARTSKRAKIAVRWNHSATAAAQNTPVNTLTIESDHTHFVVPVINITTSV